MTTRQTRAGIGPNGAHAFCLFTRSARVSLADLADMVEANALDAPAYALDWGVVPPTFQTCEGPADVPLGGIPCGFFDGLSVPDAEAFHTTSGGRPSISVDATAELEEVQRGFSHEWKELIPDMSASLLVQWVDKRGKVVGVSFEACDPVQNVRRYVVIHSGKHIAVSAHVNEWWFIPDAPDDVAKDSEGSNLGSMQCGAGYVQVVNFTDKVAETINGNGDPIQLDRHPATRGGKRSSGNEAIAAALRSTL